LAIQLIDSSSSSFALAPLMAALQPAMASIAGSPHLAIAGCLPVTRRRHDVLMFKPVASNPLG